MVKSISIAVFFLFSFIISLAQPPAFPGAVGFGAKAIGGRGGVVIEVTNLNDSGPGSFRAALETSGARIIVFRVGGIIELKSDLQLTQPFVTIAGQTAPGDGIVLKNFPFSIFTHDVIIRGMRFRVGDDASGEQGDLRDCMAMQHGTYNIIVDHCSFSWALDENVSLDSVYNATLQWCIISEALYKNRHPKGPHSMGLLTAFGSTKNTFHHNLLAHNNGRNPLMMGGDHEFFNNVIYDWGYNSEFQESGNRLYADIQGNYWKPLTSTIGKNEFPLSLDFDHTTPFGSKLFCVNNMGPNGLFFTSTQIQSLGVNAVVFSDTSLVNSSSSTFIQAPAQAYDTVLKYAGALHPQRDVVDLRVVKDVRDSTGRIIDCIYQIPMLLDSGKVHYATDTSFIYDQVNKNPAISPEGRKVEIVSGTGAGQVRMGTGVKTISVVNRVVEAFIDMPWSIRPDSTSVYKVIATCDQALGGWPMYTSGNAPVDMDKDGMPDAWELSHNLNSSDASDRNTFTLSNQGYTNVEVYLNEFYDKGVNSALFLSDQLAQLFFKVTPNPFNAEVQVTFNLNSENESDIFITDIYGKRVSSFPQIKLSKGQHEFRWNGKNADGIDLPSGVYFLNGFNRSCKLVLVR